MSSIYLEGGKIITIPLSDLPEDIGIWSIKNKSMVIFNTIAHVLNEKKIKKNTRSPPLVFPK